MTGEAVATALGIVATVFVIVAALWRFVVLPNLREQLFEPVQTTRRQVTENKHANTDPTLLDKVDDLERAIADVGNHVDLIGLNLLAVLKRLGEHIGESTEDRAHLWLIIGGLIHEESRQEGRNHDTD